MLEISHLLMVSAFSWSALALTDTILEIAKLGRSHSKNSYPQHEYDEHGKTNEEVLKNMKHEIEPCDDFYQFACGNFTERVQIRKGSQYVDAYTQIEDTFTQQIRTILTEERPETDPNHFKLPNKFFKSCINTTLIESLADEPVRQISNSLGGWPVVVGPSWDSDNSWNWQDLAKKLWRLGFSTSYFMSIRVGNDVLNNTRTMIYLYKPTFVLRSDFDKISSNYYTFMADTAASFGARGGALFKELQKALTFERDLIDISEARSNLNYLSNLLTIKQLQELYPYVQWLDLINALLPEGFTINENEIINLLSPGFFDKLGPLLARTEKRTIANYIMWKFHYFSMKFLSERFRKKRQEFELRVLKKPVQEDRVEDCTSLVSDLLQIATSSLYANNYLTQISKSAVTKIFENIRSAFSQTLHDSEWLDDETKAEAMRKLHSMKTLIGFPDELFDVAGVEEYYRKLEIDENKHFQSYLNIKTFDLDKEFHALQMPADDTEWLQNVMLSDTDPRNDISENQIRFPAACLQGRLFNTKRPNYMNYGSIGSVLGHELIHSFAGIGCEYCADGEEREWWQPASKQALTERENCFIEQYSNYTDKQTGLKIDGGRTLEENIADNSGAKISYLAYKQWQATHGVEPRLRGLKYTPQQMFWISFAQTYCGKFTFNGMKYLIKKDTHSPHEFRIFGVLSNMKDFSADFQCPKNSPMNPVRKCEIW